MAAPATLDPSQYLVSFNGNAITGFAPGTLMKASRNEDSVMLQVGADGDPARIRNRNRSGTVEVTLTQAAAANDVLASMASLDEAGLPGGTGALLVKDNTGRTVISAEVAWVKKQPDVEWSRELTTKTWVFETANLAMFAGGNN